MDGAVLPCARILLAQCIVGMAVSANGVQTSPWVLWRKVVRCSYLIFISWWAEANRGGMGTLVLLLNSTAISERKSNAMHSVSVIREQLNMRSIWPLAYATIAVCSRVNPGVMAIFPETWTLPNGGVCASSRVGDCTSPWLKGIQGARPLASDKPPCCVDSRLACL